MSDELTERHLEEVRESDAFDVSAVHNWLRGEVVDLHARDVRSAARNPAFRWFWLGVHVLHRRRLRLIRTGSA